MPEGMTPASMLSRLAAAALGVILLGAASAEALEGRLMDRRTGQPVAGAEIAIAGLSGSARTDQAGRFVWIPDPRPPFVAIVLLPGGQVARIAVSRIDAGAPLVLTVDPTVTEELTVTGVAPSVDAAPGSARTVVSSAEFERRAPANLMEALDGVPGVSGVAEGQNAVPAVRGLARGRTLVLVDGGRIFSERRAGPSVSFLAPETMDRIDVARGPASVAYGSDAFGGVISVRTRAPRIGAPLEARVAAMGGVGVPAFRVDADLSSPIGSHGAVLIHGRRREARDYSSPDGLVPNSAWSDAGGLVRATAATGGGLWTAAWQGDEVGESGRPRSDSATLRLTSPFERSQRGSVSFDRGEVVGFGRVNLSAFVGNYTQRTDQDRLATAKTPRRIDRADISGTDFQVRATAQRAVRSSRLIAGVDVNGRRGLEAHDISLVFNAAGVVTSETDNASIASAQKTDTGVFGQIDVPVGAMMTVSAGGRFNAVRSVNVGGYFGDRVVSHQAMSGLVALTARPAAALTLTVQIARGFRDPTLSDRFYRGPVGRGFIIGNPDLAPEKSLQVDVSARYAIGRLRVAASFYHYRIADLIERYQSGSDTFLFRNRGLARVRGVELETQVDVTPKVVLVVGGQVGQGRSLDDGSGLDDIAPPSVTMEARAALGHGVTAFGRLTVVARDDVPGPTEVVAPGHVDAGAGLGWRMTRHVEVRASGANLLNQRYYSSPGPRWVLAPGATGALTVVIAY